MKSMDKISTGIAYGTSAGSAGYWFLQLLDRVTPSQWAAIGVLGSLVIITVITPSPTKNSATKMPEN
ncbi:TPA: class II holin family protein [Escherichia coli]